MTRALRSFSVHYMKLFTLRSRGAGPTAAEARRRLRSRGSHMDLADGLEMGSPYLHLHSPDLALSLGTGSPRCGSSPLGESALLQHSLPRRCAHYGHSNAAAPPPQKRKTYLRSITFRTPQSAGVKVALTGQGFLAESGSADRHSHWIVFG